MNFIYINISLSYYSPIQIMDSLTFSTMNTSAYVANVPKQNNNDEIYKLLNEVVNDENRLFITNFLLFIKTQQNINTENKYKHINIEKISGENINHPKVVNIIMTFKPRNNECFYRIDISQSFIKGYRNNEIFNSIAFHEYEPLNEKKIKIAIYIADIDTGRFIQEYNFKDIAKYTFIGTEKQKYKIVLNESNTKVKYSYDSYDNLTNIVIYDKINSINIYKNDTPPLIGVNIIGNEPELGLIEHYAYELKNNKHFNNLFHIDTFQTR